MKSTHAFTNFFRTKYFDLMYLILGGAGIFISRFIFRSQYLFHWDSVQFALALNSFDISHHQPHPPGYILYIYLGKVINWFTHDAHLALILLSILASIVGFILLFYLARAVFSNTWAGVVASILFI